MLRTNESPSETAHARKRFFFFKGSISHELVFWTAQSLQGMSYICIADLIMWKQTLCATSFYQLRNTMLSHLDEDSFKDDSEPISNFSLEGMILEPSDNLPCEGLHNSKLP